MNTKQILEVLANLSWDDRQVVFCDALANMDPTELVEIMKETFGADDVFPQEGSREMMVGLGVYPKLSGGYDDVRNSR